MIHVKPPPAPDLSVDRGKVQLVAARVVPQLVLREQHRCPHDSRPRIEIPGQSRVLVLLIGQVLPLVSDVPGGRAEVVRQSRPPLQLLFLLQFLVSLVHLAQVARVVARVGDVVGAGVVFGELQRADVYGW